MAAAGGTDGTGDGDFTDTENQTSGGGASTGLPAYWHGRADVAPRSAGGQTCRSLMNFRALNQAGLLDTDFAVGRDADLDDFINWFHVTNGGAEEVKSQLTLEGGLGTANNVVKVQRVTTVHEQQPAHTGTNVETARNTLHADLIVAAVDNVPTTMLTYSLPVDLLNACQLGSMTPDAIQGNVLQCYHMGVVGATGSSAAGRSIAHQLANGYGRASPTPSASRVWDQVMWAYYIWCQSEFFRDKYGAGYYMEMVGATPGDPTAFGRSASLNAQKDFAEMCYAGEAIILDMTRKKLARLHCWCATRRFDGHFNPKKLLR